MAESKNTDGKSSLSLSSLGAALADWCEQWFPDAYIFAALAVVAVTLGALAAGRSPIQIGVDFGKSFWSLIPFSMQMAFVVIGGYVVAVAPPVKRLIMQLASVPKTPRVAVAYVAFICLISSLLSWGLSLIIGGMLSRELCKRIEGIDYRAMGAASFVGLGSIWALGASSSAALLMNTKSSIPPALYQISGTVPLQETLLTWQNLVMILVLSILTIWICYASCPQESQAKTVRSAGIIYKDDDAADGAQKEAARTPGEWLEFSPILTVAIGSLGVLYLIDTIKNQGGLAATDLNIYNFFFLFLGMLLHWTPRSFLKAASQSVPMTGGVLLQFPLYAGIFGIIMGAGLTEILAKFFISISTKETFPVIVGAYSAILGLFLPSGGGKWIVEAPYLLEAANELKVNLGWIVQCYNAAEALPNFVNPFWMLPLLGMIGVKARDLAGFSILQLVFHTPVVLIMLWLLGLTVKYVPPIIQ